MADKFDEFEQKVKRGTVEEAVNLPCPKCGGELDFHGCPDETYMMDGTFVRSELLWCSGCDLNIEVEQVYKPVKCYVAGFDDTFCEEEV